MVTSKAWPAVLVVAYFALACRLPAVHGAELLQTPLTAGDNVVMPTTVVGLHLAGGSAYQGRLEVQIGGSWGTVCSTGFGPEEARVACRELGLGGGAVARRQYPKYKLRYAVRNVVCRGNEERLASCRFSLSATCPGGKPVGVICKQPAVLAARFGNSYYDPFGPVPIITGNEGSSAPPSSPYYPSFSPAPYPYGIVTAGRLEVMLQGQKWGTVCDGGFGDREAQVACRMLGLTGGRVLKGAAYGPGTVPVRLGGVRCKGGEQSLGQCHYVVNPKCSHAHDVSVECSEPPPVPVRLVGDASPNRGRLEVQIGGRWGTVCGAGGFNQAAAELVCTKLGLGGGKVLPNARFGPGKGPILMSGVKCGSNNLELSACTFSTRTGHCKHSQDISIVCNRGAAFNAFLTEGKSGYVVATLGSSIGKVCKDGFTAKEAHVVCRGLKMKGGSVLPDAPEPSWLKIYKIAITNARCKGSEQSLADCTFDKSSVCPSGKSVAVRCR